MLINEIENWYNKQHRDLPFRHTHDPYTIWISEVMLQQTQMETMIPYFKRFMERFPNVMELAKASLNEVLVVVQGIGYYRRFKLLHQGAIFLVETHQGVFPSTYAEVRSIPGIGEYTAGAIMSIAFNQPYAATDGNVIRVLSRYYGLKENLTLASERKKLHARHQQNIEHSTPRIYTQAVMELGALVCKPKSPHCEACPLQSQCFAFHHNLMEELPKLEKKQKQKVRYWKTFVWIEQHKIALVRNEEALLEGMFLLPQEEIEKPIDTSTQLFKHIFSHQTWLMDVTRNQPPNLETVTWVDLDELHRFPIPRAHQKILKTILSKTK